MISSVRSTALKCMTDTRPALVRTPVLTDLCETVKKVKIDFLNINRSLLSRVCLIFFVNNFMFTSQFFKLYNLNRLSLRPIIHWEIECCFLSIFLIEETRYNFRRRYTSFMVSRPGFQLIATFMILFSWSIFPHSWLPHRVHLQFNQWKILQRVSSPSEQTCHDSVINRTPRTRINF